MDKRHGRFPAPVKRDSGAYQFRDVRIVDYPYFLDIRAQGLARHPLVGNLPQLTMAWASPLEVERNDGRRVSQLLWSSPNAWLSEDRAVTPQDGQAWEEPATTQRYLLAASISGRFRSFFQSPPMALQNADGANRSGVNTLVKRSPEAARIIVFSSNDFLSDRVLGAQVRASGTQYLGPIELFNNTLDWALQDEQLLEIRSGGHFNRTLPPMAQNVRVALELVNYAAAFAWLLALGFANWLLSRRRRARYMRELGL